MLDQTTRNVIAREMRKRYDAQPKGAIPQQIWRLLLAIEAASPARPTPDRT